MSSMNEQKNWHRLTADETLRQLGSGIRGLSAKEAGRRLRKNGRNPLFDFPKKKSTLIRRLLTDPALLLFGFVSALAMCFSSLAVTVPGLVVFVFWLGYVFWQMSRIDRTREALEQCGIPTVRVLRNGKPLTVSAGNVVVGDVLLLKQGDVVPADCRLIAASELQVLFPYENERTTVQQKNAETIYPYQSEVNAPNCENILYAGSEIANGTARAAVIAVGKDTFCGTLGFTLRPNALEKEPKHVAQLSPYFRLWSFAVLILFFPIGIIGLLISPSSQSGMRVFLPICAWVLTSSAVLPYCYLQMILHHGIRGLFQKETDQNGALIKSTKAVDRLSGVTDLFLMGRCATSDGKAHFHSAFTGEGVITPSHETTSTELYGLSEAFCLLETALKRFPQHLIDGESRKEPYLLELISASGYDREALAVRVLKTELYRGKIERILDVETTEGQFRLRFYTSPTSLFGCGSYQKTDGTLGVLDGEKRRAYQSFATQTCKTGCSVTTVVKEYRGTVCLIGCLATREAFLGDLAPTVSALERMGISPRLFLKTENASDLAYAMVCIPGAKIVKASETAELSDASGNPRIFLGYTAKQVKEYVLQLKKQGRVIGAVSCDVQDRSVMSVASVSIGCDICSSEDGSYSCCNPILQRDSDVLISRASQRGGGLSAVLQTVQAMRQCSVAFSRFFERFFTFRFMQAAFMIISILMGMGSIPAHVILLVSLPFDLFLLSRAYDGAECRQSNPRKSYDPLPFLKGKRLWLISVMAPALFTLFIGSFYHLGLFPLECCYFALFVGMALAETLILTLGKPRLKLNKRTVQGLLALWIPLLALILLSCLVPAVSNVTELGFRLLHS